MDKKPRRSGLLEKTAEALSLIHIYITLNTALARCPEHLRDYVALHELVHFLHHDHGPGFYAAMDAQMPGWRERRKELQRYGAALTRPEEKEV